MSGALKPCPFCGSTNLKVNESSTRAFVECKACKARGPKHESQWESRPFAEHNWNLRPRETELENNMKDIQANYQAARSAI